MGLGNQPWFDSQWLAPLLPFRWYVYTVIGLNIAVTFDLTYYTPWSAATG